MVGKGIVWRFAIRRVSLKRETKRLLPQKLIERTTHLGDKAGSITGHPQIAGKGCTEGVLHAAIICAIFADAHIYRRFAEIERLKLEKTIFSFSFT